MSKQEQANILKAMLRKAKSYNLQTLIKEIHEYAQYCNIELDVLAGSEPQLAHTKVGGKDEQ